MTQPSYIIQESSQFIEVCAKIESNGGLETNVEAEVIPLPSTASEIDFSRSIATLIFTGDYEEQCVNVSVVSDRVLEMKESFLVFLNSRDSRVDVTLRYATVTVIDSASKKKELVYARRNYYNNIHADK